MEELGGMDKALQDGSIFILSRTIPLMNSPLSRLHPAKARPAEDGMPHVQGYQDSQANPDSSARRSSSSLHPPHLANSPIQVAYHQNPLLPSPEQVDSPKAQDTR
jgi:hypothetical protein